MSALGGIGGGSGGPMMPPPSSKARDIHDDPVEAELFGTTVGATPGADTVDLSALMGGEAIDTTTEPWADDAAFSYGADGGFDEFDDAGSGLIDTLV